MFNAFSVLIKHLQSNTLKLSLFTSMFACSQSSSPLSFLLAKCLAHPLHSPTHYKSKVPQFECTPTLQYVDISNNSELKGGKDGGYAYKPHINQMTTCSVM